MIRSHAIRSLPRLTVPLAALAAIISYGTLAAGGGGNEITYLALLSAGLLAAMAALAPRPAWEPATAAVLAVLAVWAVPPGPERGAAISLLLGAGLAVAASRRLCRESASLSWEVALALALGVELLFEAERWLAPRLDLPTVWALVGAPAAAATALTLLARRRGRASALLAGAVVLPLGPGWNGVALAAVAAIAAGEELGRGSRLGRGLAVLGLAAVLFWHPPAGALAAAAGVALAAGHRFAWGAPAVALLALGAAALAPARSLAEALALLAWVPLLVPGLVMLAIAARPERLALLGAGAVLALAGALGVPAEAGPGTALAAPLALFALVLGEPFRRLFPVVLQGTWSAFLLFAAALAAAYPWLRPVPLDSALALIGLAPGWPAALGVMAAVLLLAGGVLLLDGARPPLPARRAPAMAAIAGAMLAAAVAAALPPRASRPLLDGAVVVLDRERPRWEMELEEVPTGGLVVHSSLAFAAALLSGTPVAAVRLEETGGRSWSWSLEAGIDTGEWAAERPDVTLADGAAPDPWVAWVPPAEKFFARRYRTRLEPTGAEPAPPVPPAGKTAARLVIERAADLPPEVSLALYQVELSP